MTTTLDDVFTYSAFEPLPEEEEVALIVRAQDGDDDATLTLLHAYGPTLRATVATFVNRLPEDERPQAVEEARAEAVTAFVQVVAAHDPERSPRLAGMVKIKVRASLAELARLDAPLNVPERTLSMFYGILRAAQGEIEDAADLAPKMGMTRATFEDVRHAVRDGVALATLAGASDSGWLDGSAPRQEGEYLLAHPLTSDVYRPYDEAEDRLTVEVAFAAVDDKEARICELSYGFTEYDPVPDAEIGFRLGYSRPKVQRLRTSSLAKMRKALGVTLEPTTK